MREEQTKEELEKRLAEVTRSLDLLTESQEAEYRRLSLNLRPIVLETMGLIPALEWYVENFEKQTGIHTFFKYNAVRKRFPERMETLVYRILQEAMNNAARHSGADYLAVTVSYQRERFVLCVRDNGCGMDPVQADRGLGLIGMRERARMLGGKLSIQSTEEKGTRVLLDFMVLMKGESGNGTEKGQDLSGG